MSPENEKSLVGAAEKFADAVSRFVDLCERVEKKILEEMAKSEENKKKMREAMNRGR